MLQTLGKLVGLATTVAVENPKLTVDLLKGGYNLLTENGIIDGETFDDIDIVSSPYPVGILGNSMPSVSDGTNYLLSERDDEDYQSQGLERFILACTEIQKALCDKPKKKKKSKKKDKKKSKKKAKKKNKKNKDLLQVVFF